MFDLTDTQTMLRDSLSRFLAERFDFEARGRALRDAKGTPPAAMWRDLAKELGIVGLGIDEAHGGRGGGLAEHLVVMETLGESLAAQTYLATAVIGAGLLRAACADEGAPPESRARASSLIERMVHGHAVLAFAQAEPDSRDQLFDVQTRLSRLGDDLLLNGRKSVVLGAPWATHVIVTARSRGERHDREGLSLVVLPADSPGISRRHYPTLDGAPASELGFADVALTDAALLGEEGGAAATLLRVVEEATLAVCAEAVGVMRRLLADTLAFSRERRQFGVPLASFQVLQHRMVDMYMALELADAATWGALTAFTGDGVRRARAVSSAKVTVNKACRTVGQGAVQIHGGMGMTEELAVSHYFRRALMIEQQWGSVAHHLRRLDSLNAGAMSDRSGSDG